MSSKENTEKKDTAAATAASQPLDAIQIEASVSGLLSTQNKYKNSKRQISISEEYRDFISLLAELCKVDMSQLVNNMLRPYFTDENVVKRLKKIGAQKQREFLKKFEDD
jgi:hypothetical protein